MNLEKYYMEEDLFPREITSFEEKEYGILFYNDENKDSFDSNHAIIYREKISDLPAVLQDIIIFYKRKGINPNIYQSISDDGYFLEIKEELLRFGFESWTEPQRYMVLADDNKIKPNTDIDVKRIFEWKDEYGTEIFEKADEPWEIDVVKRALRNDNTLFFVAFYNGKPVGMTHCHITNDICRVDYLLVSKEYRNIGVGRAIIYSFVEFCHSNQITNCYLWPDGDTAEKMYREAGFRYIETKEAGRATMHKDILPEMLDRKVIYESDWVSLYSDKVKMPDGRIFDAYHKLHYPHESVCVVIVNEKDEILMIQSKRYVTSRLEWEIPAGRIESNEKAEEAARRECLEETGCTLKDLKYLCCHNPSNGMSDLKLHVFGAKVATESMEIDTNEVNAKKWIPKDQVIEILRNNDTHCGVSMLALLYAIQFYI